MIDNSVHRALYKLTDGDDEPLSDTTSIPGVLEYKLRIRRNFACKCIWRPVLISFLSVAISFNPSEIYTHNNKNTFN